MPSRSLHPTLPGFILIVLALGGAAGCDEADPVEPQPETGTVIVSCDPETICPGWSLHLPDDQVVPGTADSVLTGLPTGPYALRWDDLDGWTAPEPGQAILTVGDTLRFSGVYTFIEPPFLDTVVVPAGAFDMGSPPSELGRDPGELAHHVALTRAFAVQTTEVTNGKFMELAQWAVDHAHAVAVGHTLLDALDGSNIELLDLDSPNCEIAFDGGVFSCTNADHPVQEVTWYGAAAFCDWLSLKEGLPRAYDHATWRCNAGAPHDAAGYRLPTEAEWEYACRAGTASAFNGGDITRTDCDDPLLDGLAWFCGNAAAWTHPVAGKSANAWGIFDLHGNVWEWCNDRYEPYAPGPAVDPATDGLGSDMVIRGGHCRSYASYCRSAARLFADPGTSDYYIGFRVIRTVP